MPDTVGNLDLIKQDELNNVFSVRRQRIESGVVIPNTDWDIEEDSSFTIKWKGYTRNSRYFSNLPTLQSGDPYGLNLPTHDKHMIGRFRLGINTTTNLAFGDGTLVLSYYVDDERTTIELDKNTDILFNEGETHDITLTFNSTTKEVKVYQDEKIVQSAILSVNLYFVSIVLNGTSNGFSESTFEFYRGVVEPTEAK